MGRTFKIPVHGDLDSKLKVAKKRAAEWNVTMKGDTRSGSFTGLVTGTYSISGGVATVNITLKPFIATWDMIEKKLREFLGD